MKTKEESDNIILKYKICTTNFCADCFYYIKQSPEFCSLSNERIYYKNCDKNSCMECDCSVPKTYSCNYKYLKQQYDKIKLMRKILK